MTNYHVSMREEKVQEWKKVDTLRSMDTKYTFKGLKEDKGYYFSVAAENRLGVGEPLETESPISPKRKLGK